ncbi:hypothetical protein COY90_00670 [Candidatus Roizmanbacteria bacterium CG_4_10_14_0_8_um_filter_39_9]|uniref:Uncharacterized protein n=1 Tax=Candidatus Roizmanbacteria bacterium CG_4_10_14_0_8_um_filter_39_9 TaxID=1974829 RepID=A0A2M7QEZ5_9BACT|nr:MAG: hypothetical protein COY90_00670 [Candidatus Roizmanbacteria bacterium CG_4_10_14_0_8_um_filter_39_9]
MKKLYVVLTVITVIIIITVITVITSRKPTTNYQLPATTIAPLPTKIIIDQRPTTNDSKRTGKVIPAIFTGVSEEQNIPKIETDLATQKRELRLKIPLTTPEFNVNFDFANDVFDVTLTPTNVQNKTTFEAWAAANYPLIPQDRFNVK